MTAASVWTSTGTGRFLPARSAYAVAVFTRAHSYAWQQPLIDAAIGAQLDTPLTPHIIDGLLDCDAWGAIANDGTAGGAVSALPPDLVGKVVVTGQDAALDRAGQRRGRAGPALATAAICASETSWKSASPAREGENQHHARWRATAERLLISEPTAELIS